MEKLRLTTKEQSDLLLEMAESLRYCNNYSKLHIKPTIKLTKEEEKSIKFPTLLITANAYIKMYMLVDATNNEISWHGMVRRNKEQNTYELYDIVMFPQHNTATHTGTDDDEYMGWLQDRIKEEGFPMKDLRCHGHSHVMMGTSASSTDITYQESMISDIQDGDFYIFMILNKKREMHIYLYDYEQQLMFTEKETTVEIIDNGYSLVDWTRKNIKENVREKKYQYVSKKGFKHGNRS